MTFTLIDEAHYDAEMDGKVLPALDACVTEGWMDPATVDWNGDALPKLDEPGQLHYCCYDAHAFDALREDGAFRGIPWRDRHLPRLHRIRPQIQRNDLVFPAVRLFRLCA